LSAIKRKEQDAEGGLRKAFDGLEMRHAGLVRAVAQRAQALGAGREGESGR
jgi:hypothetical protein